MEDLIREVGELKKRIDEQGREIERYREMESDLRSALTASRSVHEAVLDAARREADAVLAQAQAERDRVALNVDRIAEEISGEIRQLRNRRDAMRRDLLAVLDAHRAFIDSHLKAKPEEPRASAEASAQTTQAAAEESDAESSEEPGAAFEDDTLRGLEPEPEAPEPKFPREDDA
jgi:cell division initiation protein